MSKYRELDCEIVRDLLPLYNDGVVSETTAGAVGQHLESCPSCKAEYEAIKTEFSPDKEGDVTTKGRFTAMMKRQKTKRVIITVFIAVISCAVLAVALCVLAHDPLIHIKDEDIDVIRAYRFETDEGPKFLVIFSYIAYSGTSSSDFDVYEENGSYVMELNKNIPLLSYKLNIDLSPEDIWVIDASDAYDVNFTELRFGDTVIWTEGENGDDEVPDYVYAYNEYSSYGGRTINGWFLSVEGNYLGVYYNDGRRVIWDLDGNVLDDSYPDESGVLPEFYR